MHADIALLRTLGVDHRLPEGRVAFVERELHVAVAVLRHRGVEWQDLVLPLVHGYRTLLVSKVGRSEVLEQSVRDHVVDVPLISCV